MTTPHPLAGLTRLALWLNSDRAPAIIEAVRNDKRDKWNEIT